MNKLYIIKLILLLSLFLQIDTLAEVSLGINLSTYLKMDKKKRNRPQGIEYEHITTYDLNLYPSVIIVPTGKFEIVPTFGIAVYKEKSVTEDVDGNENTNYDDTHFGVGGGCGFFLRVIRGKVLRLSLGPDLFVWFYDSDDDNNESVDVSIGLPAHIDFLLSERLFLRLGSRLVTIKYVYQKEGANEHTNSFTFFDLESMLQAYLGFFFTF